jgi:signal transduction histidine kinase
MARSGVRWRSIDRKLPLLIAGLVLGTVIGVSWTAYVRVERILMMSAAARLQGASTAVALLLTQSAAEDKARLVHIARDPAIIAFLDSGRDPPAARRALAAAWSGAVQPQSRVELRNGDGIVVLDTTQGRAPRQSGWIDRTIAARGLVPADPVLSPFHAAADSVYGEAVVAIALPRADGISANGGQPPADVASQERRRGYVSEVSFLAASGVQAVRDLIGAHATMLLGSPAEGVWTDLEHLAAPPPPAMQPGHASIFDAPPRGAGVGAAVAISGTPWVLWVELPRATVLAPMRRLLVEIALLATFFIVIGAAGGWFVSRGITGPLVSLTNAAEQVAAGDGPAQDAPTITVHDEVTRLADAFARMAERVTESRRALERQVAEARALAGQLDTANAELRVAVATAGEARDAAQAASRAKSDFLAVISHELRTPLNAIIGYAELLQDGVFGPVTVDQHEKLYRMRRSADQLLRLINQVLDIERTTAGRDRVLPEPTALGDLVRGAVAEVELQAAERGLRLVIEPSVPSLIIVADADKLRQILLNLLSNAVKYTERGEVRVGIERRDASLELIVQDTGIGIRPEHRARIFEPFWQADQRLTRKVGGTGLGLAIVHRLTELLGGEISVESTPGAGSTFTVRLPVSPPQHAAA